MRPCARRTSCTWAGMRAESQVLSGAWDWRTSAAMSGLSESSCLTSQPPVSGTRRRPVSSPACRSFPASALPVTQGRSSRPSNPPGVIWPTDEGARRGAMFVLPAGAALAGQADHDVRRLPVEVGVDHAVAPAVHGLDEIHQVPGRRYVL